MSHSIRRQALQTSFPDIIPLAPVSRPAHCGKNYKEYSMKRILCFLLSCLMITSSFSILSLAKEGEDAADVKTEATFELAYGGATGIFSMTFDDGNMDTTLWLNEVFERYNLYGSTMNITDKNFKTDELVEAWQEVLSKGRLESENHSKTHDKVLPAQWWSNYSKHEANNTEANYQSEIVDSYYRILEVTGRAPLCFAPSNNTLHDDAVKVVAQYHYAMRQGLRWNLGAGKYQSLDPIVNATYNSHETNNQTAGAGGWYNPYMMSFASNPIKDGLDFAANNGAWLITMCHSIGPSGDVDFDVALDFFEHAARLQNEGKLWVTTFGNATKYIRERQNSTVSAVIRGENVILTVTMAEKTADNLPLDTDVFNHPLTVKVAVGEFDAVTYTVGGARKYAKTFVENGKTYAYVDVIPNSGECIVTPIDLLSESGITPSILGTIQADGTFSSEGVTVTGNATRVNVDAYQKVYAKLDLSDCKEYNTASISLAVSDARASGQILVYGLTDNADINGWSATSINGYNAPANNRYGASVDLAQVYANAPLGAIAISGAGNYTLNLTDYVCELLDREATAGTLIFVLDEASTSRAISFEFTTSNLYTTTINFDAQSELVFPSGTSVSAYAAADVYSTGGITKDNFSLVNDGAQTNALKVQFTSSKWNLFKILNFFPEDLTHEDIGRKFVITFKMKESDSEKTTISGIRMGMVGTHTSGVNCGNVGGGSADNKGTQYNSVVIKNTAFDTWETFTYEFEVTEEVFAGSRPAEHLGFYANVNVARTMWFDDFTLTEIETQKDDDGASSESLYTHTQNFEGLTVDRYPTGFSKLGFGTFLVSADKNATNANGASQSLLYESIGASYERIYYLGATPYGTTDASMQYTEADIGRTFRVSFKINTPNVTKINVAMVCRNNQLQYSKLPDTAQKASYTISEEATNTWVKITYTFTVTTDFLAADGHFTEMLINMGSCKGASETNKAKIYLDDFKVLEIPATSSNTLLSPTEWATVGASATTPVVSLPKPEAQNTHTYGYAYFDKSHLSDVTAGILNLSMKEGFGQDVRLIALREDLLSRLTLTERYHLLSRTEIDPNYIWRGFDLALASTDVESLRISLNNYLSEMEGFGASFLFVQKDVIDTVHYELIGANAFLSAKDYTTDGTLTTEGGIIRVSGTSLTLNNVLDNTKNNVAIAGKIYYVRLKASAGVRASFLGTEAVASEDGTLLLCCRPKSDEQNPKLTLSADNSFTVTSIRVDTGTTTVKVEDALLTIEYATDKEFVKNVLQNVSLDTSIAVNFFFREDTAPLSVQDESGKELLNRERTARIGDATYYVVSVRVAPKDAYRPTTIKATLASGLSCTLDASISRYARKLLSLENEDAYIQDAKTLMRYSLNYIRETALAYGGASEDMLKAFETDITVDKTLHETIYKNEDVTGIDAFCLDLCDIVGMVWKVKAGFVGTVDITMGERTLSATYTADSPCGEAEYLILGEIEAYVLREDIQVRVSAQDGTTSAYTFNLATYVKSVGTDALYAVYAYATEATSYHAKYPNAKLAK